MLPMYIIDNLKKALKYIHSFIQPTRSYQTTNEEDIKEALIFPPLLIANRESQPYLMKLEQRKKEYKNKTLSLTLGKSPSRCLPTNW